MAPVITKDTNETNIEIFFPLIKFLFKKSEILGKKYKDVKRLDVQNTIIKE